MRAMTMLILNIIGILSTAFAGWQTSIPESVIKRINEDRFIFVRVDDQALPASKSNQRRLEIGGIMLAAASQPMSFDYIRNYANLKKISSVIKTSNYNAKTGVLLFVCEAFKYRATMHIKMDTSPAEGAKDYSEIRFKVIEGTMQGYEGKIIVRSEPKLHSKIEFDSQFDYLTLPVPKLFVEFGFGIIFQKIAERLRTGIEEERSAQSKG
jgi:hypothetical protein